MEGGKDMKSRIIFKSLFVTLLIIILIGLITIIFDKTGTQAHVYSSLVVADYKIVYDSDNDSCLEMEELLYEDDQYEYYLPCASSYDIYLEWSDGSKDLLKDALRNNKVTMESLIDHGLRVYKYEKQH